METLLPVSCEQESFRERQHCTISLTVLGRARLRAKQPLTHELASDAGSYAHRKALQINKHMTKLMDTLSQATISEKLSHFVSEVDIGAMTEQDVHNFIMTSSDCSNQSRLSKVILCETRQLIQSAKFKR